MVYIHLISPIPLRIRRRASLIRDFTVPVDVELASNLRMRQLLKKRKAQTSCCSTGGPQPVLEYGPFLRRPQRYRMPLSVGPAQGLDHLGPKPADWTCVTNQSVCFGHCKIQVEADALRIELRCFAPNVQHRLLNGFFRELSARSLTT